MSKNFAYLKSNNEILYNLAVDIENKIYSAPESVLTLGTAFLENLVRDIYEIKGIEYPEYEKFSNNVRFLFDEEIITKELKTNILDAAKVRNEMHKKINKYKNYIDSNKLRAIKMHKLIFKVSFEYFAAFYDSKCNRPKFIHPSELSTQELAYSKCVICGEAVNDNTLFCNNCNLEITQYSNLKSLTNAYGYEGCFRKEDLIKLGFDKSSSAELLFELQNQNLIRSINDVYKFNIANVHEFQDKIEQYHEVEMLVYTYFDKKIVPREIKKTNAYIKGKLNEEPYINFYKLILKNTENKFLEEYKHSDFHNLMDSGLLSKEEFNNVINNENFIDVKKDLKGKFLNLKMLKKSKEDIISDLFIEDELYDEFDNDNEIQNQIYLNNKQNYLNSIVCGKSYPQALVINNLRQEDIDKFLDEDEEFRQKYNKVLTQRKEMFLSLIERFGIKKAFEQSKLTEDQLRNAFVRKAHDDFYVRLNSILMKLYLKYRKEGKTAQKAAKKCCMDLSLKENWMNNEEFKAQIEEIKINLLFNELQQGDLSSALKIANISEKEFNKLIIDEYNKSDSFILEYYSRNIFPEQFESFMKIFVKNSKRNALKNCELDDKLLKLGINQDDKYYNRYLEAKINKYVDKALKLPHTKALRKSELSSDEYLKNKTIIDEKINKHRKNIVLKELKFHDKNTKQAAKKAGITVGEIYGWYAKGQYSIGECRDFADEFDRIYVESGLKKLREFKNLSKKDKSIFIKKYTRDDFDFWNKNGVLIKYPEINVEFEELPDALAC